MAAATDSVDAAAAPASAAATDAVDAADATAAAISVPAMAKLSADIITLGVPRWPAPRHLQQNCTATPQKIPLEHGSKPSRWTKSPSFG